MIIQVPKPDKKAWPTLGPYVCDYIVKNLVHGPGDILGQEPRMDRERMAWIYCLYEVYPQGHPRAGRRRYEQAAFSLRKGLSKTEWAAWLVACELAPDGPVRTVGWDRKGYPIGGPVGDPYIPMVAYTEDQTEELAYGALRVILQESKIRKEFDIGLARIMRVDGHGKAEALATSPNAADGARTTFQHFDETHRMVLPRLKKAYATMLANIPKRREADAWSLETTTAFAPGEGSVAEETMAKAQAILDGKLNDPAFFFYHRQASDKHNLSTKKGLRAAIAEATGREALSWAGDSDKILRQLMVPPNGDRSYSERVWLNRLVRAADKAFDPQVWAARVRPSYVPADYAKIVIGFDGARRQDATALIGTEILTGHQWPIGVWERPYGPFGEGWEVSEDEVNEALDEAINRWDVWRVYADPPYWETTVDAWCGRYGEERVVKWYTASNHRKVATAVQAFANAMRDGHLTHDGSAVYARHVGNAYRRMLSMRDEKGEPLWVIQKSQKDSPNKIDAAMAGVLSWEARRDAVTLGIGQPESNPWDERVARGEAPLPTI